MNTECFGNLCHQEYRWRPGELWYGDYSFPHQVINQGEDDSAYYFRFFKNPKNLFVNKTLFDEQEKKKI